jgi:hypothetical protein
VERDPLLQRRPQRREQRVPGLGQAAAENDRSGIDQRLRGEQPSASAASASCQTVAAVRSPAAARAATSTAVASARPDSSA